MSKDDKILVKSRVYKDKVIVREAQKGKEERYLIDSSFADSCVIKVGKDTIYIKASKKEKRLTFLLHEGGSCSCTTGPFYACVLRANEYKGGKLSGVSIDPVEDVDLPDKKILSFLMRGFLDIFWSGGGYNYLSEVLYSFKSFYEKFLLLGYFLAIFEEGMDEEGKNFVSILLNFNFYSDTLLEKVENHKGTEKELLLDLFDLPKDYISSFSLEEFKDKPYIVAKIKTYNYALVNKIKEYAILYGRIK